MAGSQNYREIAAIAQARRDAAIPSNFLLPDAVIAGESPLNVTTVPRASGHFTRNELEIIESEAVDILLNIKEKLWTALQVTEAFCKAAVVANQLVSIAMFSSPGSPIFRRYPVKRDKNSG
jgi:amidase